MTADGIEQHDKTLSLADDHEDHGLKVIYIAGPWNGGPGLVANAHIEGTHTEVYPNIS